MNELIEHLLCFVVETVLNVYMNRMSLLSVQVPYTMGLFNRMNMLSVQVLMGLFTECVYMWMNRMSLLSVQVVIALQEKEVKYEPVIIDIHNGEQNQAWFLRLNSSGVVPTLQDGEKIITESEDIVDYIDREFPTGNN